ncbi:MAG: dTMP kinase [Acidocella sp. 20-57-95]|nr:MAG: dTMP kinase [Acidocella sp. 20-57-95]OYV58174.1 MAG: dTMP kinase [Acidocella sp. 21-58-7]HQT64497.1 dTMP kinase [Acidocella sp.]HQU04981.1 dTMP kinase [Acidocella sp.]
MNHKRGVFISFEGGEGAGKSTAARALAETLQQRGHEVVLTREPGGTKGAEAIRGLLLNPETILTPMADTLLHFAARADHVANIIAPALARSAVVICDRFYDSTMAYQGYGFGVDLAAIRALVALVGLKPDLTIMLEVSDFIAKQRLAGRGGVADRYEQMGADVMARIAAGFRVIAEAEPDRCVLLNADDDAAHVQAEILALVHGRFGL